MKGISYEIGNINKVDIFRKLYSWCFWKQIVSYEKWNMYVVLMNGTLIHCVFRMETLAIFKGLRSWSKDWKMIEQFVKNTPSFWDKGQSAAIYSDWLFNNNVMQESHRGAVWQSSHQAGQVWVLQGWDEVSISVVGWFSHRSELRIFLAVYEGRGRRWDLTQRRLEWITFRWGCSYAAMQL